MRVLRRWSHDVISVNNKSSFWVNLEGHLIRFDDASPSILSLCAIFSIYTLYNAVLALG